MKTNNNKINNHQRMELLQSDIFDYMMMINMRNHHQHNKNKNNNIQVQYINLLLRITLLHHQYYHPY